MKNIILVIIALASFLSVSSQKTNTLVYSINRSDTLKLDFYKADNSDKSPLLIYVFGGGFKGGTRNSDSYNRFFDFLTSNGVSVASIDYRTELKDMDKTAMMTPDGFKNSLVAAIDTAVTDLLKATSFLYSNSTELNINPDLIFASGSSAGAITVLQAEYNICNESKLMKISGLPQNFNYAGIIAMAGAICSQNSPQWGKIPAPVLLFHGDADAIVPFEKAILDDFGLWGSKSISDGMTQKSIPHRFHIVRGASHEINISPMSQNIGEIYDFITSVIEHRCGNIVITDETNPEKTDYKKDFTIVDYIKANL